LIIEEINLLNACAAWGSEEVERRSKKGVKTTRK